MHAVCRFSVRLDSCGTDSFKGDQRSVPSPFLGCVLRLIASLKSETSGPVWGSEASGSGFHLLLSALTQAWAVFPFQSLTHTPTPPSYTVGLDVDPTIINALFLPKCLELRLKKVWTIIFLTSSSGAFFPSNLRWFLACLLLGRSFCPDKTRLVEPCTDNSFGHVM